MQTRSMIDNQTKWYSIAQKESICYNDTVLI